MVSVRATLGHVVMRVVISFALVACSKSGAKHGSPTPPGNADQVIAAWQKGGLDTSGLKDADGAKLGLGDAKCQAGAIDGLETTLCEYPTAAAAKEAVPKGAALVGQTTGTSLAEGKVLLVLANRKNIDHDGKQLNKIAQTFRHAGQQ